MKDISWAVFSVITACQLSEHFMITLVHYLMNMLQFINSVKKEISLKAKQPWITKHIKSIMKERDKPFKLYCKKTTLI